MVWRYVCKVDELAVGELSERKLDGEIAVVVLKTSEVVRVIPPFCPHMEEPMENGFCDGEVITCSKHFWEWNAPDGSARESADKPLHLYETKLEDGKIFAYVEHEFFYEYDD